MTHDEMIELIAAHRDGKMIQCKDGYGNWIDVTLPPLWNFSLNDYRIKPVLLALDECWKQALLMDSSNGVLVRFLKLAKENGHV